MNRLTSQLAQLLSHVPHETNTADGRSQERHRRIALSALASALSKLIAIATVLISVPLTLNYLGAERFGIWMMISSLVAILAFADLGIGNGLLNSLAAAYGRDDVAEIRRFVSSGYVTLSLVAVVLLAMFALVYQHVQWATLFNVETALARQEAGPAAAMFFICFVVAIPVALVQRIQIALQQSFTASLWQCLGSLLGLLGVVVAVKYEAGLPWLVLAFFGAPLLSSLANSAVFFGLSQPAMAPRFAAASLTAAKQLLRIGGLFLVLQLVAALAYASDSFIIAQLLGADRVPEYAIPERMFSMVSMVLLMALTPLWPAYGEAIARGDAAWVRRTLRRSVVISVALATCLSLALVVLGPALLQAWVGSATAPLLLLLGLGAWKIVEACATALAVFLNGANVVGLQLVLATLTLIVALALKLWLVPRLGVAGVVWATVVAYLACALVPYFLLLPKILNRVAGRP